MKCFNCQETSELKLCSKCFETISKQLSLPKTVKKDEIVTKKLLNAKKQ